MPYSAVTQVQGDYPEQIAVIQDQPVRVLDSKRSDWWLVSSIPEDPEDSLPPSEGWIKAALLRPDGESPSAALVRASDGESSKLVCAALVQ